MDVHRVLALAPSLRLDKARADPLDLYTRLRLLLDVLDKQSLRAYVSSVPSVTPMRRALTPGPTTLARTLKFRSDSSSINSFSSGHFLCQRKGTVSFTLAAQTQASLPSPSAHRDHGSGTGR